MTRHELEFNLSIVVITIGVISTVFSLILTFVALRVRPAYLSRYQHILVAIALTGVVYSICEICTVPYWYISDGDFILFSVGPINSGRLGQNLLVSFAISFMQSLFLISYSFLFQYAQVCRAEWFRQFPYLVFFSPFINVLILTNWLVAVVYCFSPTEAKVNKASKFVFDHLGMTINNRAMLGFSLDIQSSDNLFFIFIFNMLFLFVLLLVCIFFCAHRIIAKVSSDLSNRNHYSSIYRLLLIQCVAPTLFTIFPLSFNLITGIVGFDSFQVGSFSQPQENEPVTLSGVRQSFGMDEVSFCEVEDSNAPLTYSSNIADHSTGDIRFLTFLAYVCREGLSDGAIRRTISMMSVVYGKSPPFSAGTVIRGLNKMRHNILAETTLMCGLCGTEKTSRTATCTKCSLSSKRLLDMCTIISLNGKHQLEQYLKHYGTSIFDAHKAIHENRANFDKFDTRCHDGFIDAMETFEEFENGCITLVCTLNSDAAKYRRLSRRDITPTFLRVESGPSDSKRGGRNLILMSISYASGGIKKRNVDTFVEKTFAQLSNMVCEMRIYGKVITFRVNILAYIADMKEVQLLTTLPNWYEANGCSLCFTTATKKPSGTMSFNETYPSRLRTDDDIWHAARTGSYGFRGNTVPIIYNYIRPSVFQVDPFHIRSAGVCIEIVAEILAPKKWTVSHLKLGKLEKINEAFDKCEIHTNDPVKLPSLRHRSKQTGRETEKMCLYLCAFTSFTAFFRSSDFTILVFGWYHALTFLGSTLQYDRGALRKLLHSLYRLHVALEPMSLTTKWHAFYAHILDHEEQFGPVFTTEYFEREHRNLMLSVNQNTTNCESTLPVRYVTNQLLRLNLTSRLKETSDQTQEHIRVVLGNEHTKPYSFGGQLLRFTDLCEEDRDLAAAYGLEDTSFLKRLCIARANGTFYISSARYWKTAKTSQSKLCWIDSLSNDIKFGEAVLISKNAQGIRVLVTEMELEPFQIMANRLRLGLQEQDSEAVLDNCSAFPTTFGKIIGKSTCIINSHSIIGAAVTVPIENNAFIKMVM